MRRLICVLAGIALLLAACQGGYKKAEDAEDAGREFIRASLNGDYKKAQYYLLDDSVNQLLIKTWQQGFEKLDPETRQSYKEANIVVLKISPLNDSTSKFSFSNSYKKDTTTLKIVRIRGEWLVDLKEILNANKQP